MFALMPRCGCLPRIPVSCRFTSRKSTIIAGQNVESFGLMAFEGGLVGECGLTSPRSV